MGKSLKGKELGTGITQRKDGLYQGRFTNRFGKKIFLYGKTVSEIRQKLRSEQYNDEKELNVVTKEITLDEWFQIWMDTCKKNCRNSTKEVYKRRYKRISAEVGYRKLTALNLIILQRAINALDTDNERKNSKKVLVDMLERAIDSDLLTKNVAKQINTVISKEEEKERRVLTVAEEKIFLAQVKGTYYYNLYVLAIETGMRIGELMALSWSDVDFKKKVITIRRTLCYFTRDGKYVFEMHDTKTKSGRRKISLTEKAYEALKQQKIQNNKILLKGKKALEEYKDLVFVTKNNRPTQQFIIQECLNIQVRHIQEQYPE